MKSSTDSISRNNHLSASLNDIPVCPDNSDAGKRSDTRRCFTLPVEISYINMEKRSDAQLIDCGGDGMCIKCRTGYKPGTSLVIRVKDFKSNDKSADLCEGPRTISVVDVKWCEEIIDEESRYFKMGLQRLAPVY